jgi:hypothetical protein
MSKNINFVACQIAKKCRNVIAPEICSWHSPFDHPPARRIFVMSNPVHNEQVKLAATFWNNLGVAALLGVFLVLAFYTRHTMLQQALSIGVGLAAAIGLRMVAHWRLRLRE